MPRRRSESDRFLDDVLAILRESPWWVGPPFILIVWLMFAFAIPAVLGQLGGEEAGSPVPMFVEMLSRASGMAAPVLAAVAMLAWVAALFQKVANARRLDRQTGIDSIRNLSWEEFEQLLAEAFRREGYRVRDTGVGADGGIDLILESEGHQTLVQAKQWRASKVGVRTVRELLGVQSARGAHGAILATSGTVTAEAQRFADANGIRVIDGSELERLITAVQGTRKYAPGTATEAPPTPPAEPQPSCPTCGATMVHRIARRGVHAGRSFWGCSKFPACRGTRHAQSVQPGS